MVAVIRHIDVAAAVHRHAEGQEEAADVAVAETRPGPGQGGDAARGGALAQPLVVVGDVGVAGAIERDAFGVGEQGGGTLAVGEAVAAAGQGGDGTAGGDQAHPVVAGIGDVDVAAGVYGDGG